MYLSLLHDKLPIYLPALVKDRKILDKSEFKIRCFRYADRVPASIESISVVDGGSNF